MGGFCSLIAYGIISYVVWTLSLILLNKTKINTSQTTTYFDITNDIEDHLVLTNGLKIAFGYTYTHESIKQSYTFAGAVLNKYSYVKNEEEIVPLEMDVWSFKSFAGSTVTIDYSFDIMWFKFPENISLKGNYFSDIKYTLELTYGIKDCGNQTQCKAVANLENMSSYMWLYVITPYVDFNDINEPIKYSYIDKYYSYVNPREFNYINVFIRK